MIKTTFLILFMGCSFIACPPVKVTETPASEEIPGFDVEYNRYLQEVFKELETDAEFKKRAENLNKTEDIAEQLDFVHHRVRIKLDELKRIEIDRLNAAERLLEAKRVGKNIGNIGPPAEGVFKMNREHLDPENPYTFEINDLERLVKKVTKDLAKVDQQQEQEYKRYEMEKEHLRKKKLDKVKDPKLREELAKKMEESKRRHEKHPAIHEPGSKEQLKEVWEKEDHLENKNFDPNTFFHLHDLNGDGNFDINEVEAILEKEVSKAYDPDNPDDDMKEKYHEIMRMRQEFFKNSDVNANDLISKAEFLNWTKQLRYVNNTEWKTAEELNSKPYNETEFHNFEEQYDREHLNNDIDDKQKTDDHHEQVSNSPSAGDNGESLKFNPHGQTSNDAKKDTVGAG